MWLGVAPHALDCILPRLDTHPWVAANSLHCFAPPHSSSPPCRLLRVQPSGGGGGGGGGGAAGRGRRGPGPDWRDLLLPCAGVFWAWVLMCWLVRWRVRVAAWVHRHAPLVRFAASGCPGCACMPTPPLPLFACRWRSCASCWSAACRSWRRRSSGGCSRWRWLAAAPRAASQRRSRCRPAAQTRRRLRRGRGSSRLPSRWQQSTHSRCGGLTLIEAAAPALRQAVAHRRSVNHTPVSQIAAHILVSVCREPSVRPSF